MSMLLTAVFAITFSAGADAESAKPITPVEAITRINEQVTVQMKVKATKNKLEKRGEIYLDSKKDFRDPHNLGIVVTRVGAAKFEATGVTDPAIHFKDATIRVTGIVVLKEEHARIEVDDPAQIQIIKAGKRTKR